MALEAKKEKQPKFGAKGKSHVSAAQVLMHDSFIYHLLNIGQKCVAITDIYVTEERQTATGSIYILA